MLGSSTDGIRVDLNSAVWHVTLGRDIIAFFT